MYVKYNVINNNGNKNTGYLHTKQFTVIQLAARGAVAIHARAPNAFVLAYGIAHKASVAPPTLAPFGARAQHLPRQ